MLPPDTSVHRIVLTNPPIASPRTIGDKRSLGPLRLPSLARTSGRFFFCPATVTHILPLWRFGLYNPSFSTIMHRTGVRPDGSPAAGLMSRLSQAHWGAVAPPEPRYSGRSLCSRCTSLAASSARPLESPTLSVIRDAGVTVTHP